MVETAKRTAIATLVVVGIVVASLALWKLRLVVGLLFSAMIIAAALRPSIEWLARRRVPAPLGLALHYLALVGAHRRRARVRRARGTAPDRPRAEPERQGRGRARREAFDRRQASGVDRAAEAAEQPAEAIGAREAGSRDRPEGVRGRDRHLLHLRRGCLLDLRARQDRRRRVLAPPATEAQEGARHVDADRSPTRRLRARTGAPDPRRRDRALAALLGRRRAVLDPGREPLPASSRWCP